MRTGYVSQTTQHHGERRRSCSSVGLGGVDFMPHGRPSGALSDNILSAGLTTAATAVCCSRAGEDLMQLPALDGGLTKGRIIPFVQTFTIKQPDPHAATADRVVLAHISLGAKKMQIITPIRAAIKQL